MNKQIVLLVVGLIASIIIIIGTLFYSDHKSLDKEQNGSTLVLRYAGIITSSAAIAALVFVAAITFCLSSGVLSSASETQKLTQLYSNQSSIITDLLRDVRALGVKGNRST